LTLVAFGATKPTMNLDCSKGAYRHGSHFEITFGRSKDWRSVATCYDRCATTFLSAVARAATIVSRL
jgi:transposase